MAFFLQLGILWSGCLAINKVFYNLCGELATILWHEIASMLWATDGENRFKKKSQEDRNEHLSRFFHP